MLSGGRDYRAHPSSGHPPASDKEQIARAALRSLAEPSAASTSNQPLLLPRPSQPAPSRRVSHRTCSIDHHYHDRAAYFDHAVPPPPSRHTEHDPTTTTSLRDAYVSRNNSSSSFFHGQHITASPDSSPKLDAASRLPPTPCHTYARHSVPSITSREIHEVALRRASLALGVNLEQVRRIVHSAFVSRHTSNSSSPPSLSASSHVYLPPSFEPQPESPFMRHVLDAYRLESHRASQSHPVYDTTTAPSTTTSNHPTYPSDPSSQPQHYLSDRGTLVAWGATPDDPLPTFNSRHAESGSREAHPAHIHARPHEASAIISPSRPDALPSAESPSPFAYDAYRAPSHTTGHEFATDSTTKIPSPHSHAYVDDTTRRNSHATDPEFAGAKWSRQPHLPSQTSMYERRVRSIDDYLEQQHQQQQQRQQQHRQHPQRRGSIAHYPGRSASVAEHDDDRLSDRHNRSNPRHFFQPYPPPSTRYAPRPLAASAPTHPLVQSPQLSPTMPEAPRFHQFSQPRSPLLPSPIAETVASVASSSVNSVAALSPSPSIGAFASSSANPTPDERTHSPAAHTDAPSPLHAVSDDAAAESTRAGVAMMQIDDIAPTKAAKSSARKSRSTRSSFSYADRGSGPIVGTDLSHSEIMQKLQEKVKSRLAAKGKAAKLAQSTSRADNHTNAIRTDCSGGSGLACSSTVLTASSTKRTAARLDTSNSPARASAASPHVSRRSSHSSTTATAQISPPPTSGVPAPKVRRTSAPHPQKPSNPTSKPSSPSNQSNTTPTSIEAALLSPTDTPTPSQAAANHEQCLSRSPMSPESAVESASGQALPSELPGAGQMNASSATKQQISMSGIDSLLQAAQANDPIQTNSAIA